MPQQLTVTVDNVIFTVVGNALQVLLVKRAAEPFAGKYALPGGKLDTSNDKDGNAAATRILREKTGLAINYLEQLKTYSGDFDPRGYTVSMAHYALTYHQELSPKVKSVENAVWMPVEIVGDLSLAFIHKEIIDDALMRLREKARYSLLPLYCLPDQFTVAQYASVLEAILNKSVYPKTLLRRFELVNKDEDIIIATGTKAPLSPGQRGKGGDLYRLTKPIASINFSRNLME